MPTARNNKTKKKSLEDLYLLYPWKTSNKATAYPYFPKAEMTNHKFTIAYPEWLAVIRRYYELVQEDMINGNHFIPPYGLGFFQLRKHKVPGKSVIKGKPFKNLHTDGYLVTLKWYKYNYTDRKFTLSPVLSCRMVETFSKRLYRKIMENPQLIYRYPDA